jgi:hypothetical protein
MDPITTKLTTTLPESPSSDTGSQPGKTGASKFDKIKSRLNENSDKEASPAQSVSPVDGSVSSNNLNADRLRNSTAAVGTPARIQQNLAASQHHLARLRDRVESSSSVGSMRGIKGRLTSVENQYRQIDSVLRTLPQNASPQQYLALQQQVYSMNENIGALSKLVEQASNGVKSILQTQV